MTIYHLGVSQPHKLSEVETLEVNGAQESVVNRLQEILMLTNI